MIYVARNLERQLSEYVWSTFDLYSTSVWIILLVSLIAQSFYGTFIQYVEKKMNYIDDFHPLGKLWQYCRLHVIQGDDQVPFVSNSGNLAFIVFALLQVTLFTNLYQTLLLSVLFRETTVNPFISVDQTMELIRSGEYTIVTYRTFYERFWYVYQ